MNIFHFITDRSYIKEEQKSDYFKIKWLKIFRWHR